ncbi:MAG: tetratricopeptide repeat protein, partial [Pseudomonadales bacterium]
MSMSQVESTMLQQIRGNLQSNRIKPALAICQQLNSKFPQNAEGWCAASVVANKMGNADKALEFIDRALALNPTTTKFILAKANLLIAVNRFADALDLAQQIASTVENIPQALDTAGAIFSSCGDYKKAQACYEKTLELAPESSATYYNLAAVKRFLGDDIGAEAAWNKAIALNSKDYDSYHFRSDIRTQTL